MSLRYNISSANSFESLCANSGDSEAEIQACESQLTSRYDSMADYFNNPEIVQFVQDTNVLSGLFFWELREEEYKFEVRRNWRKNFLKTKIVLSGPNVFRIGWHFEGLLKTVFRPLCFKTRKIWAGFREKCIFLKIWLESTPIRACFGQRNCPNPTSWFKYFVGVKPLTKIISKIFENVWTC